MSNDRLYSMRGIAGGLDWLLAEREPSCGSSCAQPPAVQPAAGPGEPPPPSPPLGRRRTPASSIDPLSHLGAIDRAFAAIGLGPETSGADEPSPLVEEGELGQVSSRAARTLLCDLSSPIVLGSGPRYRLGPPGAERSSADRLYSYQWTVRRRGDDRPVWQTVTPGPEIRIIAAAPGRYQLEVAVLADGAPSGLRLSLVQDVEVEPAALTTGLRRASAPAAQAMRELVNDLRGYVVEAAVATGEHGVPVRLLAAVLFIEILSRPRPSRERELDELDRMLDALARGERVLFPIGALDRTLGVGQLRPAIAAMVLGATPWIDPEKGGDRRQARDRIRASYDALTLDAKRAIFTRLRWPRSNIAAAARLLSTLKNRPNRYPALTHAQLAADPHAIGVVATEYISGATAAPAADAKPSGYGSWVWQQMQDPLVQRFFPD